MQYILKVAENFERSEFECDCDRDNWWNSNLAASAAQLAQGFPYCTMQDNETHRMLVNQSFCTLCSTFSIRSWYAESRDSGVHKRTQFASLVADVCVCVCVRRNLLPLRRSINKLHFVCHNDFGRDAGKIPAPKWKYIALNRELLHFRAPTLPCVERVAKLWRTTFYSISFCLLHRKFLANSNRFEVSTSSYAERLKTLRSLCSLCWRKSFSNNFLCNTTKCFCHYFRHFFANRKTKKGETEMWAFVFVSFGYYFPVLYL